MYKSDGVLYFDREGRMWIGKGGKQEKLLLENGDGLMFDGEVRRRGESGGRWRDSEAGGREGWRGEGGLDLEDRASGWKSFQLRGGAPLESGGKGRGCAREKRRCWSCVQLKERGLKSGLERMQGYEEVGKARGKMDIFWTSLTRPWWKSSKPKLSGGALSFSVLESAQGQNCASNNLKIGCSL